MELQTLKQVQQALKGKHFRVVVDLGIGFGEVAPVLKKHCDYLIGVDKDIERVILSGYDILYDKLIKEDVRNYIIPAEVEVAFMFDLIEHLNLTEGLSLLSKIGSRFCILTTPSKFYHGALDGHISLWSIEDLNGLGFETVQFSVGFWRELLYGWKIIGVRGGSRL